MIGAAGRQTHSRCVAAVCIKKKLIRLYMLVPFKKFPSQHIDDDINTRYYHDMNTRKSSRNEVKSDGWHNRP